MYDTDKPIIAIDLGSQEIKVAVAQEDEDGELRIPAHGTCTTEGFVNGCVKDMDKLKNCIYSAVNQLQQNWGEDVDLYKMPVFYSVSGDKITGRNIDTDMRQISNLDYSTKIGSVSEDDMQWLKNSLEAHVLPSGVKKIGMIKQCFQVDDNGGIDNPIGLNGREIKAAGHLVTDSQSHIADLENAIIKAFSIDSEGNDVEIETDDIKLIPVAASFASSLSVLTEDQKETGVALLDIGEGCCDLAIFWNKYPVLTWCNAKAGGMITRQIKDLLRININEAEKIKKNYAYADPKKAGSKEEIEVASIGKLKLEHLAQWVNPVVISLFESVNNVLGSNIEDTTYERIISQNGVVLTGGTANLKEITTIAMSVLQQEVKIGKPNVVKISDLPTNLNENPSFSTLIGLCIYGTRNYEYSSATGGKKKKKRSGFKAKGKNPVSGFFRNFMESIRNIEIT